MNEFICADQSKRFYFNLSHNKKHLKKKYLQYFY